MSDLMVSAAEVDRRIIPAEDLVADYGAPAEVQFPDSAHKRRRQQLLVVERFGHLSTIERPAEVRGRWWHGSMRSMCVHGMGGNMIRPATCSGFEVVSKPEKSRHTRGRAARHHEITTLRVSRR